MSATAPRFRVSVGHLANFVHRGGDIGPRATPAVSALEGLQRAQRHQQGEGERYRSEVRLTGNWCGEGVTLDIGGRADGVLEGDGRVRIEELKTHRGAVEIVREREGRAHDAQLRLYGALWLAQRAVEDERPLELELVYLEADTEACERHPVAASPDGLRAFLDETCRAYARWLGAERVRLERRDTLLRDLAFPAGDFRPGQRTLARAVWRTLTGGQVLLAQAPTGIGKTLGVVYAALRRLPGVDAERLVYLTPRGSARALALDAVRAMDPQGAGLRAVELVGRERICPHPERPCRADACERAAGHFDRRRGALAELLDHGEAAGRVIGKGDVETVSSRHRVCPVALQRDAARFSDLVVGDYNYGFDPFARQRALLDPEEGGAALLVDEAHNLPERARAMFSVELDQAALREAAREARRIGASFARPLDRVADEVREAGAGEIEALLDRLETLLVELGRWLVRAPAGPPQARFEALRGDLSRFLEVGRLATGARSDAFLRRFDPEGPRLHLQCLDPAPLLREAIDALAGLVLFSATLGPAPLRRLELGLPEHSQWLALPNPYPPERRLLLVADDLDLRSRAREANLKRLVATIVELVDARAGHYLVFAPSFLFLGTLADALGAERPDWCVQRQARGMSETEREAFVDALRTPAPGRTRVALAVAGGLFAEGVDLPGEALIGVVVAGLPLPAPDVERRALADYHGAAGRDLAFRAPAVTRVLQAAGRLVRDEADSGIVCIVDARLREQEFRRLFPEDWNPARVRARDAGRAARAFWARQGSAESPEP